MGDNDSFRLIDPDEAVAWGCLLIFLAALAFTVDEEPKPAPPLPQQTRPCDLTIAQFGPGERWIQHAHVYECVSGTRELPTHLMTYPLVEAK